MYYSLASYYTEDLTWHHRSSQVLRYTLRCPSLHHAGTGVLHHAGTGVLHHAGTGVLHHAGTGILHHAGTGVLHVEPRLRFTTPRRHRSTTRLTEASVYYTTTYAAQNNYIDAPKYYTNKASEHTLPLPLLTLPPPATPKFRKQYSGPSYYTI
jgi:hypothetical protein